MEYTHHFVMAWQKALISFQFQSKYSYSSGFHRLDLPEGTRMRGVVHFPFISSKGIG
jgi:hypothetical protein